MFYETKDSLVKMNSKTASIGIAAGVDLTKSLLLDGVDEYATAGDILDHNSGDSFSIVAWVKPNATAFHILSKATSTIVGWEVLYNNQLIFFLASTLSNAIHRVGSAASISTGSWAHIAVTYDGSGNANNVKMYVNNVRNDSSSPRNNLTNNTQNASELTVGTGRDQTGFYLDGNIAHVAHYDVELSAAQVSEIYNGGSFVDLSTLSVVPTWYPPLGGASGDDATAESGVFNDLGSAGPQNLTPKNTEAGDIVVDAP